MSEEHRIRWHCRRGLLEVDLVLQRFLDTRFPKLTAAQRHTFSRLLEREDGDLWDLISGRTAPVESDEAVLVEMLRAV